MQWVALTDHARFERVQRGGVQATPRRGSGRCGGIVIDLRFLIVVRIIREG